VTDWPADQPPLPARLAADTIRAIRRFHTLDQAGLAACFKVSTRTVIRWEKDGLDTTKLDPKWRVQLLKWLHGRYQSTASPDNPRVGEVHP
jgi:DNA-binding XRE family transcriptional regulator